MAYSDMGYVEHPQPPAKRRQLAERRSERWHGIGRRAGMRRRNEVADEN